MSLGVAPSLLPKHGSIRLRRIGVQTHMTLVTPAERPHPFPSRTRKLSSPAPKILRGQPFGKIGRRQDFCVSWVGASAVRWRAAIPVASGGSVAPRYTPRYGRARAGRARRAGAVSYTHLRAHETRHDLV